MQTGDLLGSCQKISGKSQGDSRQGRLGRDKAGGCSELVDEG